MNKKRIGLTLLTALTIFIVLSYAFTLILGVPLWWAFNIKKLEIASLPSLEIQVSPETPVNIGEKITVIVTNSSSGLPVENATVYIAKDSMRFEKYTDSTGKAVFEYLGEVTVVCADKDVINPSDYVATPKSPELWVRNYQAAMISAAFGGLVSGFATFMFQRNKSPQVKRHRGKRS